MPFLLLLLLMGVCLWEDWPPFLDRFGLPASPLLSALLTWSGAVLLLAGAFLLTRRTTQQLRRDPSRTGLIFRRYGRCRFWLFWMQVVYGGLALFVLGWGWAVQGLGPIGADGEHLLYPGAEVLILLPCLLPPILSWLWYYDVEKTLHQLHDPEEPAPFRSRWHFVGFQMHQRLALLGVPLILLIAARAVEHSGFGAGNEDVLELAVMALLAGGFLILPWLLRLALRLRPLPAGALRERLLASCRRLGFQANDLLLWDTRHGMANAMVVGLLPWLRYIIFTDRLVEQLPPEELEAVLGHEVGHLRHRHMLYYLSFFALSVGVLMQLWGLARVEWLGDWLPATDHSWANVPFLFLLGGYVFLVFGFLSRRCERQADLFGCRAVSCGRVDCVGHDEGLPTGAGLCATGIHTFISALERVADLNGIHRNRPGWLQSWQHSTIARRVAFLEDVRAKPITERRFQRRVFFMKWLLLAALAIALVALAFTSEGRLGLWGM